MPLPNHKPLAVPAGISAKIDLRLKLQEQKAEYDVVIKKFEADIQTIEAALIEQMDTEQTTRSGSKNASVTIVESVVPNVDDWDAFYKYIGRTKYFHLLERRASVTGCRELFETKGVVPGVQPFTKRRLNFTKLKG